MEKLIVCNWKMNLNLEEAVTAAKALAQLQNDYSQKNGSSSPSEIWIASTSVYVSEIVKAVQGSSVRVGLQNCHWEEKGAYTGENSALIAKSAGASFSLIGHSERRSYFGETDELISKRFNGCLKNSFTPVLCVGETLEQRKSNLTEKVILQQLEACILSDQYSDFVVAYEPVWSIGTGVIPSSQEIGAAHKLIRQFLDNKLGGNQVKIVYGGSANPDNFAEIMSIPNVNGGLPGGASLDVKKIEKMMQV